MKRNDPIITYGMLKSLNACESQLEEFRALFGDAAIVNRENCLKGATKFNWLWAATMLFPPYAYNSFNMYREREFVKYSNEEQSYEEYRTKLGLKFLSLARKYG